MQWPGQPDLYRQLQSVLLSGKVAIQEFGKLSQTSTSLLHPYQQTALANLVHYTKVSPTKTTALIGQCGTGKTPVGMGWAKELKLQGVIVICPLIVMDKHREWAVKFGIPVLVVNYETLKLGKIYAQSVGIISSRKLSNFLTPIRDKNQKIVQFGWKIPSNVGVIFDEVHLCSNPDSLNGKLMLAVRNKCPTLLVSATLANTKEQLLTFGYMLGKYPMPKVGKSELEADMKKGLHKVFVPKYATTLEIDKRSKKYRVFIWVETYTLPNKILERIEELWSYYSDNSDNMRRQHRVKRIIEQYLVLHLQNHMQRIMKAGNSVILYLNYRKSVSYAAKLFKTSCIVEGGQDMKIRQRNIRHFQNHTEPMIICNLDAGGLGMDLDDKLGDGREHFMFLRPGEDVKKVKQAIGRTDRVTAKSNSHCYIMLADTPTERAWRDRLATGVKFMDELNETHLSPLAKKLKSTSSIKKQS
jgi:superfamily II DNA or RNA helicase